MNSELNIAVNDREELIYLLTEAAEFEHVVMCTYLYAQWSLKRHHEKSTRFPHFSLARDRTDPMLVVGAAP